MNRRPLVMEESTLSTEPHNTMLKFVYNFDYWTVWPDWAIYLTLGNFLKPYATIYLPKSTTFLGNFCKGVKIYHLSSEILFGQLL